MSKEYGGYLELERFYGKPYHSGAIALNSGRSCLEYIIKARKLKKIYLPAFICESVKNLCIKCGVKLEKYHIGKDFLPDKAPKSKEGEAVYIVNYYGQLKPEDVLRLKNECVNIILDNAQSFFTAPPEGIDTLYTCRKFFGVSDGAYLYTDAVIDEDIPKDESYDDVGYIMGRFERPAGEFYSDSVKNNKRFAAEGLRYMSAITENILRAVDYERVISIRNSNFAKLDELLRGRNTLAPRRDNGPYMYPFLPENHNAGYVRKKLAEEKIFIPVLWPGVESDPDYKADTDHFYAENILPLPCDQRYSPEDMEYIVGRLLSLI